MDDADKPRDWFEGRQDRDVIRVRLKDGRTLEGSYLPLQGMHFVHVRDGTFMGKVEGPIASGDVEGLRVIRTRREIEEELYDRKRGDPVPGTLHRTRDGYEARLDRLARAAAREEDRKRRQQIENQFHDVADEIELAQTKRKWILAVASWTLHHNEEPTKLEMSGGCMVTAQKFQRPRPQDFDPDPKVRRARVPVPEHVRNDPLSTVNMRKAFNDAGFNARVSVLGELTWDVANLLVDFPGGKKNGRFAVEGKRGADDKMEWGYSWEGNCTPTDLRRMRRCQYSEEFKVFHEIVLKGLDAPVLARMAAKAAEKADEEDETPAPGFR